MSASVDDMMDNMGLRQQYPIGAPTTAAPARDHEQDNQDLDLKAYGLAVKAGDNSAAAELHNDITARQQRISQRQNNPTKDMSSGQRFAAGMGRGALSVADTLGPFDESGNEVAPGAKYTDPKIDKPLLDTTAGSLGNVAGQVAATLPVGGAGSGLTKALMASKFGGSTLGRVAARAGVAGAEGGASNALSGEDAGEGAAGGAALSIPLGAAGRLFKGAVGKSDATQRLYQDAEEEGKDLFVPISQGGTGLAKQVYQKALPYALGVETQLKNQSNKAKGVMSEVAAEHGMPIQDGKKVPAPIGDTMEQTAQDMRSTYDRAYQNTVKSYAFKPNDFQNSVLDNLSDSNLPIAHQKHIAGTVDSILQDFTSSDGSITGENLLRAKAASREALENLKGPGGLYRVSNPSATNKAVQSFDDIVQDTIDEHKSMGSTPGASGVVRDLENFQKLGPAYAAGNAVASTAEGNIANRGELKFGKLAENAPENSPLRSMSQDVHEGLEKESPGAVNPAGRHFLHSLAPLAAFTGHMGTAGGLAAGNLAGNVLATKTAQKILYGDTATQQAIARALRNNPRAAHLADYAARQGVLDAP